MPQQPSYALYDDMGILHTQADWSQLSAEPLIYKELKYQLNRKRLLSRNTTSEISNNTGKTRGIEPTQIPASLREHNRGQEQQQTTRATDRTQTRRRNNNNDEGKQSDPHKKLHSPPPEGEWSFMWGGRPRHERKTKPNNNRRGRRGTLNEERQTVHCKLVRELRTNKNNRKNKNHQEKTRLPSTALLAQGTLVKTVLILARRVSLELLSSQSPTQL